MKTPPPASYDEYNVRRIHDLQLAVKWAEEMVDSKNRTIEDLERRLRAIAVIAQGATQPQVPVAPLVETPAKGEP
jgi:hypothetical protein